MRRKCGEIDEGMAVARIRREYAARAIVVLRAAVAEVADRTAVIIANPRSADGTHEPGPLRHRIVNRDTDAVVSEGAEVRAEVEVSGQRMIGDVGYHHFAGRT